MAKTEEGSAVASAVFASSDLFDSPQLAVVATGLGIRTTTAEAVSESSVSLGHC